jgi:DNA-binding LacI/PurR family transcriptional regulator
MVAQQVRFAPPVRTRIRSDLTFTLRSVGLKALSESGFNMISTEPAHQKRPATIADVASAAGVSASTVSRVVNNSAAVAPAKQVLVEQAIRDLHYRPSAIARGLAYGRTMTIGAVVPFLTHPSAVQRVRGLVDGLRDTPFPLSLYDVEAPQHRLEHFEVLTGSHPPMGTVVMGLEPSPDELVAFGGSRMPVVFIEVDVRDFSTVDVDHQAGGRIATEHLIELGHERIGFVGDEEDNPFGFTSSALHRRGYLEALASSGIRTGDDLVLTGSHGRTEARVLAERMLTMSSRPTAVFSASDTQAMGVLDAARSLRIDVPHDLSVVGFDDIEMSAHVGLTTVHQPLEESGRIAAKLLIAEIEGRGDGPVHRELPVELVVRESTGPA